MERNNGFGLHSFVFILGLVLLFLAAFPFPIGPSPSFDPWRGRLFAAGMFCWMLSTAV
jgi:hypothetical protein